MMAYTMSSDSGDSWHTPSSKYVSAYTSYASLESRGSRCSGESCGRSGMVYKYISELGQAAAFSSSSQAGSQKLMKFGDALYSQSNYQTYDECVSSECSIFRMRRRCRTTYTCQKTLQVRFCGYANHSTGLIRYTKVGTVGMCIPEAKLATKWFVKHKVCPSGHYHRTRKGTPGLQICDCNDACP